MEVVEINIEKTLVVGTMVAEIIETITTIIETIITETTAAMLTQGKQAIEKTETQEAIIITTITEILKRGFNFLKLQYFRQ
jgi:hypothetical protein